MNNLIILGIILFFIGLEVWYVVFLRNRKKWDFMEVPWFKIKAAAGVLSFICVATLAGIRLGFKLIPKRMWSQIGKYVCLVLLFILFLLANKWLSEIIKPKDKKPLTDSSMAELDKWAKQTRGELDKEKKKLERRR